MTNDPVIGFWNSRGKASGEPVYQGPQGGIYRMTDNGSKVYVTGQTNIIKKK